MPLGKVAVQLPKAVSLRTWTAAVALAATALIVITLRGPCYIYLPNNRLDGPLPMGGTGGSMSRRMQYEQRRGEVFASSASSEWFHMVSDGPRTLTFDVCDEFADQRLALIYGMVIAKRLGRTVVLPRMVIDRVPLNNTEAAAAARRRQQHPEEDVDDVKLIMAPFEEVYDLKAISAALAEEGVEVMTESKYHEIIDEDVIPIKFGLSRAIVIDNVDRFFGGQSPAHHMTMECPLFKLAPNVILGEERFIWNMQAALRPAKGVVKHLAAYRAAVRNGPFNFLHLLLDKDWHKRCRRCGSCGGVGWVGVG